MIYGFKQKIGFVLLAGVLMSSTAVMAASSPTKVAGPSGGFWDPVTKATIESEIKQIKEEADPDKRKRLASDLLNLLLVRREGVPLRLNPGMPTTREEQALTINALLHIAPVLTNDMMINMRFVQAERGVKDPTLLTHLKLCHVYYLAAFDDKSAHKSANDILRALGAPLLSESDFKRVTDRVSTIKEQFGKKAASGPVVAPGAGKNAFLARFAEKKAEVSASSDSSGGAPSAPGYLPPEFDLSASADSSGAPPPEAPPMDEPGAPPPPPPPFDAPPFDAPNLDPAIPPPGGKPAWKIEREAREEAERKAKAAAGPVEDKEEEGEGDKPKKEQKKGAGVAMPANFMDVFRANAEAKKASGGGLTPVKSPSPPPVPVRVVEPGDNWDAPGPSLSAPAIGGGSPPVRRSFPTPLSPPPPPTLPVRLTISPPPSVGMNPRDAAVGSETWARWQAAWEKGGKAGDLRSALIDYLQGIRKVGVTSFFSGGVLKTEFDTYKYDAANNAIVRK